MNPLDGLNWNSIEEFRTLLIQKNNEVKLLQDKLEKTQKLLEEKERELSVSQQLVSSLKEILGEMKGKGKEKENPKEKISRPNELKKQNASIKGRRVKSLLSITNKDEEMTEEDADKQVSWRSNWNPELGSGKAPSPLSPTDSKNGGLWRSPSFDRLPTPPPTKLPTPTSVPSQPWKLTSAEVRLAVSKTQPLNSADKDKIWKSSPSETELMTSPSHVSPELLSAEDSAKSRRLWKSKSHSSLLDMVETHPSELELNPNSFNPTPLVPTKNPTLPSPMEAKAQSLSSIKESPKALRKSTSMSAVTFTDEENRQAESKFPSLEQMVGQLYALTKYQQGCRFLQKKLDENDPAHTALILSELFDHLVELMTDPFGNYLFTKLIEHCDQTQRELILNKILPDVLATAFDMYGAQSLQKMLPFLTDVQIVKMINALRPTAIALIKHPKANYFIQYCLDHLPQKHNQWIHDAVVESISEIARDRVGCVVVKRCIDHASDEQMINLINEITNHSIELVQDPFGNYVVQYVLEKFPTQPFSSKLIRTLIGSITDLCVQKFSSNVVEKCLQVADKETKSMMLVEIMESDILPQLLNDRFANFVIQTALDVADAEHRARLVQKILPHLGHYSPYTKRLQKKILQT